MTVHRKTLQLSQRNYRGVTDNMVNDIAMKHMRNIMVKIPKRQQVNKPVARPAR